jgi:ribonuclease HI
MGGDAELPRARVVFPPLAQVHFDGACQPARGGGVATYGFTVEAEGLRHEEYGLAVRPWSPSATNNVAEYTGAIRALEWLGARGFRGQVILLGDSQLVIRQMRGDYQVRNERLRSYWEQLHRLAERFSEVRYEWIPREENVRADELSKLALEEAWAEAGRHRPVESFGPPPEEDEEAEAGSAPGPGGPDD